MSQYLNRIDLTYLLPRPGVISIVGAGGKTTLMFDLAKILSAKTVATTTTKVGVDQIEIAETKTILSEFPPENLSILRNWVSPSLQSVNGKIIGCSLDEFSQLAEICKEKGISIVNEADGANHRHLKAPAAHEPVIPKESNACIYVVGLDVLGKPLNADNVHRPEIFEQITQLKMNENIDAPAICRMLEHPMGGLKGMPESAMKVVYLTHADTPERIEAVRYLADNLQSFDYVCTFKWVLE